MCSSIFHTAAIICFFLALTINLVAIATPGWLYSTAQSEGLFNSLASGNTAAVARTAAENVAFAFSLLADMMLLAAIVVVAVGIVLKKEIAKIGGILAIVAAVFIMIGLASYAGLRGSSVEAFGYSFGIGWVSCVLSFAGGIVALIA